LAKSVGQAITRYMHDLLDLMFNGGLSEPLRRALVDIGRYVPPLLATIQGKSFDMMDTESG
jgi:FKBP12-rapamycin complex-associated protein